jgi:hypothetical protein
MTRLEFQASMAPDGTVRFPQDIASRLEDVPSFRVCVEVPDEDEDDAAWRQLSLEYLMKDDAPGDAIYDDL